MIYETRNILEKIEELEFIVIPYKEKAVEFFKQPK